MEERVTFFACVDITNGNGSAHTVLRSMWWTISGSKCDGLCVGVGRQKGGQAQVSIWMHVHPKMPSMLATWELYRGNNFLQDQK